MLIGVAASEYAWPCSCEMSPPEKEFAGADAVVEAQVLDVDRGYIRLAWCRIRGFFGADIYSDDFDAACGIRATVAVHQRWKGPESTTVRIATGRDGGDCGVPFQAGESYLLYLRQVNPSLFATNICVRPLPYEMAAADREALSRLTSGGE